MVKSVKKWFKCVTKGDVNKTAALGEQKWSCRFKLDVSGLNEEGKISLFQQYTHDVVYVDL